ncbi:hypothetical protein QZH41_006919 [Actinostola sp. cb2023]|nr:hypothetical protein QZH41_006919 [Actinostola sp. cb2023]
MIQFLKEQFSRHGIPDCIVTDNAPQLVSHEFHQFSVDWEFEHVSSSPLYPKSNGKAESSVKVTKRLFKKALRDDKDPWLALLDQRNTPTEGLGSSPAQRLMSRRTKGLLPTASTLLHPKVVEGVKGKIKLKKQKAKYYHDRTAKTLPELEVGQDIRVAPTSKYQQWSNSFVSYVWHTVKHGLDLDWTGLKNCKTWTGLKNCKTWTGLKNCKTWTGLKNCKTWTGLKNCKTWTKKQLNSSIVRTGYMGGCGPSAVLAAYRTGHSASSSSLPRSFR